MSFSEKVLLGVSEFQQWMDQERLMIPSHRNNVDKNIIEHCAKHARIYPKLTPETFENYYNSFWNCYYGLNLVFEPDIFCIITLALNYFNKFKEQPYEESLSISEHSFEKKLEEFQKQDSVKRKDNNPIHNLFKNFNNQERLRDTCFYAYTSIRNVKGSENAIKTRYSQPSSFGSRRSGSGTTIPGLYFSIYSLEPRSPSAPTEDFCKRIRDRIVHWVLDILWPTISNERIKNSGIANYTFCLPFSYHGLDMVNFYNRAKDTLKSYNPNVKLVDVLPFRCPIEKERFEFLEANKDQMKYLPYYGALDPETTNWYSGKGRPELLCILIEIACFDNKQELEDIRKNKKILEKISPVDRKQCSMIAQIIIQEVKRDLEENE